MLREFAMPDVGEGLTEAEVIAWNVGPGDTVTVNQVICEIETAKAAVELPCPYAGTVGALLVEPGQTVEVGAPIITIETAEASPAPAEEAGAKIGEAGKDGRIANLVGYGPRPGSAVRRPRRPTSAAPPAVAGPPAAAGHPAAAAPESVGPSGGDRRSGPADRATSGSAARTGDHAGALEPATGEDRHSGPAGRATSGSAARTGDHAGGSEPATGEDRRSGPADRAMRASASPSADHGPGAGAGIGEDQRFGSGDRTSSGSASPNGDHVGAAGPPTGLVPLAKPPVRKLARDLGVDLRAVTATGSGGVITRGDLEAHLAGPVAPGPAGPEPAAAGPQPASAAPGSAAPGSAAPGSAAGAPGGLRREPIRGVRKATAAAMVRSAFTAPHVTEFLAVDITATMALRDRLRPTREYAEVKLTPLAFVAKAVCLAARRTPAVNAHWDEAAGEIVYYDRVQLGIAAATPRGLIVPKVRDADTLTLRELAESLGALTATARSGRTPPADLAGGTFTITNVGVFGVDTGTPILNPGEAAILAVGSIKPAPWVVDGELAVRTVCQLALSFDHRLVDGEQGSRFLADVGALLTDPGLALTW